VGFTQMLTAGSNYFSLEDLLPERSYQLCAYFENQFHSVSSPQCVSFRTQNWGSVSMASI
jgi:hypothetical protein